ncbi:hypothetical protein [Streptomyces ipomoeae]|uniref:hypothetical protein n=1 Tax=Streptomyces ipomoeae TaxID=103232 RepID=UPI0011468C49|nr:hypothetical protein [Streptomyces ipomoeae]TQE19722.1 hypothetical protein Sipo7851_43380 [Streptomyces ipomoeae]
MRTCHRFSQIRQEFEQEIGFLANHSELHVGRPAAKISAKHAMSTKQHMAKALSRHIVRCPECG